MLNVLSGSPTTLLLAVIACVLGSFTIYANIGLLAASAWLISSAALNPPVTELSLAIVGVRFFGLARAVCRYGERYVSHDVTFRLLADIRVWLFSRVELLPMRKLAQFSRGDIFSRLVADVETLQFFYLRAVFPVLISLLVISALGFLLCWLAPWLMWPVVGLVILTGYIFPLTLHYQGAKAGKAVVAARADFNEVLTDNIDGLTELAAFGQVKTQETKAVAAGNELRVSQEKANTLTVLAEAMGILGLNITVIIVIILAAPMVTTGELNGVYLAAVALAVQASFEAVLPLQGVVYYLQESLAAIMRLKDIDDNGQTGFAAASAIFVRQPLTLTAENLSFSYSDSEGGLDKSKPRMALCGVNFCLPPGKKIAVVGASGAGKSTLAGLILRFWDVSSGTLKLNNADIGQYAPDEVRKLISVVSQDTYLFNASIRDNILMAKPDATTSELMAAVEGAMLKDFIWQLPQGLDTKTGQNGLALSGGERQRIALARALLKAAPIWLLDEPTAGLDATAEQDVLTHIFRVTEGKSMLLITHRLTGLEIMDEIIVLDNGEIAEQGNWQQLLADRGLFHDMWKIHHEMLNIS